MFDFCKYSICLVVSLLSVSLMAQNVRIPSSKQLGLPLIQNFSPKVYVGNSINYGATQDPQGMMYIANGNGVLQYDGSNWRLISLPNDGVAYSVGCAANGVVYVGGEGDLGYLAPDERGTMQFQSLLEWVPERFRDFTYGWQIAITEAFVYFMTDKYLLRWEMDEPQAQMKAWVFKNIYHTTHVIEGEFYVWEWGMGLEKVTGDSLQVVPGGEAFAEATIRFMTPLSDSDAKLLIGTVQKGFAIYDGTKVEFFRKNNALEEYISKHTLFNSIASQNGNFVFGTLAGGIVLTDRDLQILQILHESNGLQDDYVAGLFEDKEGGIWAATGKGLSRIELSSSLTFYKEELGLNGHIQGVIPYEDLFFAYGFSGIFQMSSPANDDFRTSFQQTNLIKLGGAVFSMISVDEEFLTGSNAGTYLINEQSGTLKTKPPIATASTSFTVSRFHQDLIYTAMGRAIGVLKKGPQGWKLLGQIDDFPGNLQYIAEASPNQLWANTFQHAIKVEIGSDYLENTSLEAKTTKIAASLDTLGPLENLPEKVYSIHFINDQILCATSAGLRKYNAAIRNFEPDLSLPAIDTTRAISYLKVMENGDIWLIKKDQDQADIVQLKQTSSGNYIANATSIQSIIKELVNTNNIDIDPSDRNIAWISTSDGLVKYNANASSKKSKPYPALVRKVLIHGDSLLFGGAPVDGENPVLAYSSNAVRFEYAALSYDYPEETRYQFWLEGFDETWSNWTKEVKKDYTNLPEGDYTFRIKAKNIYGQDSLEDYFSFVIAPPWYRSWWAYLIYIVVGLSGLIGIIYAYNAWRTRRLMEQNLQLEKKVAEQTKELHQRNEELKELDQLKSQFFTNISHEFRTPLTIISGMANQIKGSPTKWVEKGTAMILRNSANLLHLINQILDLRKLERGGMQINYIQGDIIFYLQYLLESFQPMAENKGVKLHFLKSTDNLLMDFDKDKIMQIFANLISNALKFTPEKGNIYIRTEMDVINEGELPLLHINVRDTGIGIAKDKLPHVFDRFFQVEGSQKESAIKKSKGSGIGLSLVQELVHLLKGQIEVNSEVGKGTTFYITLPITNEAPIEKEGHIEDLIATTAVPEAKIELPKTSPNEATHLQELEKPQLLIVDDNPDVVHYLHSLLDEQYSLRIATDGEEGIEMALSEIPDLIISDVMMPFKNGYELCDTLKKDTSTSHIPIVLLTSRSDEESKLIGLERGADAYLTKPFNPEELFLRLKKLHDLRLQLQARYSSIDIPKNDYTQAPTHTALEDVFINKLKGVIEANLDDHTFGIHEVCQALRMSRTQLHYKIKALTNRSTSNYIRGIRLYKAKELLREGNLNITQVAIEVGFNERTYFTRAFIKEFGMPPSEFVNA